MLIREVIAGTFFQLKNKRVDLAKALIIPLLLSLSTEFLAEYSDTTFGNTLILFIDAAIQTVIAITTHRIILLGHNSVSEWGLKSWSNRETTFFMHYSLLIAISYAGAYALPIIGLDGFGMLLVIVAWLWVWSRLSLVFPAIAVEQPLSFRGSWEITKNYQLLMSFIVLVLPLFLAIPIVILNLLPFSSMTAPIFSALILVIAITALSIAYHAIKNEIDKGSV